MTYHLYIHPSDGRAWHSTIVDNSTGHFPCMRGEVLVTKGHYYIIRPIGGKYHLNDPSYAIRLLKPLSDHERTMLVLKYGFPCLPVEVVEKYYQ